MLSWHQNTPTHPCHDVDGRVGLGISCLLDGTHGGVERLTAVIDGRFPLPAELPDAPLAFPVARRHRIDMSSLSGLNGWRHACSTRKRDVGDVDGRESDPG